MNNMSTGKLDENKIYVLKTAIPMYSDYEISEETFKEMSEERKKRLENNFYEILEEYLNT